ncbi:MAG: DNA/RNA helicase domain-containing protein [Promethearchaeota archaeon]
MGIKFVHEISSVDQYGLYLSGNGALVLVLQNYIGKRVADAYIRRVVDFISEYRVKQQDIGKSKQKVIVFDEVQGAWDAKKVGEYYRRKKIIIEESEPDILIQLADQIEDWAVVLCLIGDGQEIHVGEEEGINL